MNLKTFTKESEFNESIDTSTILVLTEKTEPIDPIELTQQLRGEVFTYIDILLTTTIVNDENKLENIIFELTELFYDFLDFSVSYLDYYKTYTSNIKYLSKHPDIHLVDKNCAILASLYEVILTIKRLFGFDERVGIFFRVIIIYA